MNIPSWRFEDNSTTILCDAAEFAETLEDGFEEDLDKIRDTIDNMEKGDSGCFLTTTSSTTVHVKITNFIIVYLTKLLLDSKLTWFGFR